MNYLRHTPVLARSLGENNRTLCCQYNHSHSELYNKNDQLNCTAIKHPVTAQVPFIARPSLYSLQPDRTTAAAMSRQPTTFKRPPDIRAE
jgi:hypothetical protein